MMNDRLIQRREARAYARWERRRIRLTMIRFVAFAGNAIRAAQEAEEAFNRSAAMDDGARFIDHLVESRTDDD
jgi:hypothetical protein